MIFIVECLARKTPAIGSSAGSSVLWPVETVVVTLLLSDVTVLRNAEPDRSVGRLEVEGTVKSVHKAR